KRYDNKTNEKILERKWWEKNPEKLKVFSFEYINNKGDINEILTDALAIDSCINAHPYVKGELCLSDDLTYTTCYFAAANIGYHRLFDINPVNTSFGGRIIFVVDCI
ncbi:hypothetical protein F1586_14200, partial [Staphylococcus sp. 6416]